jgi:hypothetical protein
VAVPDEATRYPAREDDHEARSDLGGGPKRFTGSKGAQVAEPMHLLDFERIERGINSALVDAIAPEPVDALIIPSEQLRALMIDRSGR